MIGLEYAPSGEDGPTDLPTHSSPLQYQYVSACADVVAIAATVAIARICFIVLSSYRTDLDEDVTAMQFITKSIEYTDFPSPEVVVFFIWFGFGCSVSGDVAEHR
jgi:hypothetical protein